MAAIKLIGFTQRFPSIPSCKGGDFLNPHNYKVRRKVLKA
jgi:hypothetical protein